MRKAAIAVGILVILGGLLGLAYPAVGSLINSLTHKRAVMDYQKKTEELPDEDLDRMLQEAEEYNEWICSRGGSITGLNEEELEEYERMLEVSGTGIMGYIEIPKIGVTLPIYHGTREEVLQVGVGHLAGSSLPIGGENTHAVLTGHSGLPSSRLFTDLDQLTRGDTFTITVLKHSATYEVDKTEVVEPEEAEHQEIEKGKDLCTLVTCTPIGVNSHRLLVRGHRTADVEPESDAEKPDTAVAVAPDGMTEDYRMQVWIAGAALTAVVILVAALIAIFIRKRRRRQRSLK